MTRNNGPCQLVEAEACFDKKNSFFNLHGKLRKRSFEHDFIVTIVVITDRDITYVFSTFLERSPRGGCPCIVLRPGVWQGPKMKKNTIRLKY